MRLPHAPCRMPFLSCDGILVIHGTHNHVRPLYLGHIAHLRLRMLNRHMHLMLIPNSQDGIDIGLIDVAAVLRLARAPRVIAGNRIRPVFMPRVEPCQMFAPIFQPNSWIAEAWEPPGKTALSGHSAHDLHEPPGHLLPGLFRIAHGFVVATKPAIGRLIPNRPLIHRGFDHADGMD